MGDIETDSRSAPVFEALRQSWSARPGYMNFGTFGPSTSGVLAAEQAQRQNMNADFSRFFDTHLDGDNVRGRLTKVAEFLGASVDEIAWVSGTSEAMNIVANGLELPAGAEVVTHKHEHPIGVYPWLYRAQRQDITVRQVDFPPLPGSAEAIVEFFAGVIGPATRVLSFSHVNYSDGTVLPVAAICRMARDRGVITVVDGAQAPGMLPVSVSELGCDVYVTSLHKWTAGIYGSGALYVRSGSAARLRPLMVETYHSFSKVTRFGDASAPASVDIRGGWPEVMNQFGELFLYWGPILAGTLVAIQELQAIGMDRVGNEVIRLGDRLRQGLGEISGVTVLTPATMAAGITSFELEGWSPVEITRRLRDDADVIGRVIDHGPNQIRAARICTHVFNTPDVVDRVIKVVEELSVEAPR
jgi:isopenicillin-N epimerase